MEIGLDLARREDALEEKRRKGEGSRGMKAVVWSWLAFQSAEVRGRVHSTS